MVDLGINKGFVKVIRYRFRKIRVWKRTIEEAKFPIGRRQKEGEHKVGKSVLHIRKLVNSSR